MVSLPRKVDVAVIGGGLGSLSCAVALARQGLSVCVLEQQSSVGGYAGSFSRRGYKFDVSLHHIGGLDPGFMTHGMLESLGVLSKLTLHRRATFGRVELPELSVVLPNDRQEILEALTRINPLERRGLEKLFDFLSQLKADVVGPTMDPDYDLALGERTSNAYLDHSFADVLEAHVSDPRLLAVLGQLWMSIGLPPSKASAAFSACVFCSSFFEGAYHIRGGGEALADALTARLVELDGECIVGTRAQRILVEKGTAVGVEVEGGEEIEASVVVSGIDPYQTFFELLPGEVVSKVYRYRINQMQPSLSMYAHYIGLDCPPSRIGIEHDHYFFNHQTDLDEAYRRALDGEVDHTDWSLTSYERSDPSLAPKGGGVIGIAEVTPCRDWLDLDSDGYAERKRDVCARLLGKAAKRFPVLEEHIVVDELATPRTMNRYTANRSGAVYGFAQSPGQASGRRLRNRAPLGGLFLTGAWTWSGGGYEGALMTGVQTSISVMDHLSRPNTADPVRYHRPSGKTPAVDLSDAVDAEGSSSREPQSTDALKERIEVRVFGYDLGGQGVTAPHAYLAFMDRGRVELIESLCQQTGEDSWLDRYTINIYKLDVVFTGISRFGDLLEVQTGLRQASSHRAAFDQRIVMSESRELVADGVVEVLFLDEDSQLAPVPRSLSRQIGSTRSAKRKPIIFPAVNTEERYPYEVPFRVYFEDTDMQEIAYHATYARFSEGALVESFFNIRPLDSVGVFMDPNYIHLSRLGMRFLRAARLGDRLLVRTRGRQTAPGEVLVEQQIVLSESDEVAAQVVTEVGFVDQDGKRQNMPELLEGLLPKSRRSS